MSLREKYKENWGRNQLVIEFSTGSFLVTGIKKKTKSEYWKDIKPGDKIKAFFVISPLILFGDRQKQVIIEVYNGNDILVTEFLEYPKYFLKALENLEYESERSI